jgi:hypothetical protein
MDHIAPRLGWQRLQAVMCEGHPRHGGALHGIGANPGRRPMFIDGLIVEHQCRPRAVVATGSSTTIVYRRRALHAAIVARAAIDPATARTVICGRICGF